MMQEMRQVQLKIFSTGSFRQLLLFGLLSMSPSIQATNNQTKIDQVSNQIVMQTVTYQLPHELGTLSLYVPEHWVQATSDGTEVLWIDIEGKPFRDNVTLTIRNWNKTSDSENFLDKATDNIVSSLESITVSEIEKVKNRRLVSFDRILGGQEITQSILIIYAELSEKSYTLMLNHSRPTDVKSINFSEAKIN